MEMFLVASLEINFPIRTTDENVELQLASIYEVGSATSIGEGDTRYFVPLCPISIGSCG